MNTEVKPIIDLASLLEEATEMIEEKTALEGKKEDFQQ